MVYPGNTELSAQAQDKVLTAFRQVISKLQENARDEAMIGLEFVLRLDPTFAPATNLQRQLASGIQEIDLASVFADLQAPGNVNVDELLVEAVENFNQRRFLDANTKVEQVLMELPGHAEARELQQQISKALKVESQVGQYLAQAREALDGGDPQEAANFVMMAQTLDPHHPGIAPLLAEIQGVQSGTPAAIPAQQPPQAVAPEPMPAPAPASPPEAAPAGFEAAEEAPIPAQQDTAFEFEDDEEDFGTVFVDDEAVAGAGTEAEDDIFGGSDETIDLGSAFSAPPEPAPSPEPSPEPPAPAPPEPTAPEADMPFLESTEAEEPVAEQAPAFSPEWDAESSDEFSFASEPDEEDSSPFVTDGEALSDLFTSTSEEGYDDGGVQAEDRSRIEELVQQGQAALDSGDAQEAIDIWSRVYLIDPANAEVQGLIEGARERMEETQRQAEQLFYEAQEAANASDDAKTVELIEEVLALQPNHLGAIEMREQLTGAAPPPIETAADSGATLGIESSLPELDESLFDDEAPAAAAVAAAPEPAATFDFEEETPKPKKEIPRVAAPKAAIPWKMVAFAAGGVAVVLVGVWFGIALISSDSDAGDTEALNRVLAQAEKLYEQGQAEEAVHLLQAYPASGLDQSRIATRLSKYQQALAPPTPTPVPDSVPRAETLYGEGRWVQAYDVVLEGLKGHPGDAGLMELKQRILREPAIATLHSAVDSGEYREAADHARELLDRYPEQGEFLEVLQRSLFNAAILELRDYNLTVAETHLQRLTDLGSDDDEVTRIMTFIEMYKTRPVDVQLRVFIGSLALR